MKNYHQANIQQPAKNKDFFIVENINIGRKDSLNWVEDSFNSESRDDPDRKQFLSLSLGEKKIKFFLIFLMLGIMILLGKSFYLQIIRGHSYFALAEDNRIRTKYVKAQRGIFYDASGEVLVRNISGFSLFITPSDLPRDNRERQAVIEQISSIIGLSSQEIIDKLSDYRYFFQPIAIETGIDYQRAMALKIVSADLPGITLEVDTWRQYLGGNSFSHLLGYVGKISPEEYESDKTDYLLSDNIGKTGLEKSYEELLRGEHGKKLIEVDALGQEKKVISRTDFSPGDDLVLAIDAKLQRKVYEILDDKLKNQKAAVVIISNPKNGEILSLVDYPNYDNNLFALGIDLESYKKLIDDPRNPLFMRSISGEYPSGSTVKIVIAAAALEENIVTKNTTVNSTGGISVGQWFFPDWKGGGHGVTNIIKAIAQSVNTYFYYIGGGYGDFKGLGVELLGKYMKLFGLGQKLGIDLPDEKDGFVPTQKWKNEVKKEPWYIGDTYHLSIGQGDLLVTPLQVNFYTNVIASGGTLYKPKLVKEVIHNDGEREILMPEVIRKDFISAQNINIVREAMRETVISGSARSLNYLPIKVAGKTGTAQWHSTKENHAWFTGFAPYDNPNFTITVLVEEGGEGSSIATPIAREILTYWFNRPAGG
ncbi:MAG: penicillin-binding protein 2 [Candidatus Buchananbacteria bacterium]|nr:penicillin-binding protein 2 [Candidatus Buchananbacteria bacterium]